jgi:hypothetical protein
MGTHKTLRILYIGGGLDIKTTVEYVRKNINILNDNYVCNERIYICVDSLPRTPNQTSSTIDYSQYTVTFTHNLIKICEELGFELKEAIELDNNYAENRVGFAKKLYYKCRGYICPEYINPQLWIFKNYKTNETIRYYISTNIETTKENELLVKDIRESNILYIHKYIPSSVLFELYNKKARKIVATYDTVFQVNKTTKDSILKVLNYNINFYRKYILITPDKTNRLYNDFNDFKDKSIKYNKVVAKN